MTDFEKIDLHMHTSVSDGTDAPEEILVRAREAGLTLFSVTDHDAVKGCERILGRRSEGDPRFICGAEFSCRDDLGKYHILGYGFDPQAESVRRIVATGHGYRMHKLRKRLDFLKSRFGFEFPEPELSKLFALDNPGKPHIGNLMIRLGYVKTIDEAMARYLNQVRFPGEYVRPEEAIRGILGGGGIPVLAHPAYGDGDQLILGEEMDARLRRLIGFGLKGLEAYYSGFTAKLRAEMLAFADRYDLYVTAGSDYHGKNKLIELGDTGLEPGQAMHGGLKRFIEATA